MDGLKKCKIIRFSPFQTTTLPKWMFCQQILFKTFLLLNGQCGIQVRPPNNSDNLCLLFCLYPSSMQVNILLFQTHTISTPPSEQMSFPLESISKARGIQNSLITLWSRDVHRLRLKFSFSMTRVQIISPYFQSIEVIPVDNSFSC